MMTMFGASVSGAYVVMSVALELEPTKRGKDADACAVSEHNLVVCLIRIVSAAVTSERSLQHTYDSSFAVWQHTIPMMTISNNVGTGPACCMANGRASDATLKLSFMMLKTVGPTLAPSRMRSPASPPEPTE